MADLSWLQPACAYCFQSGLDYFLNSTPNVELPPLLSKRMESSHEAVPGLNSSHCNRVLRRLGPMKAKQTFFIYCLNLLLI